MIAGDHIEPSQAQARGSYVIAAVVIVVAFVGFFSGTRPHEPAAPLAAGPGALQTGAPQAPTYQTLLNGGPVGRGGEAFASLKAPAPVGATAVGGVHGPGRAKALEHREVLRAYEGAPPTIPHPVDATALNCLACHEQGVAIGERVAPKMSHERYASCTQCHAAMAGASPDETLPQSVGENTFAALPAPLMGSRAWPGAPPQVPHSTLMRSDCMSCHGPSGDAGLKTSHPWRQSCQQCHAGGATLDQQPAASLPGGPR